MPAFSLFFFGWVERLCFSKVSIFPYISVYFRIFPYISINRLRSATWNGTSEWRNEVLQFIVNATLVWTGYALQRQQLLGLSLIPPWPEEIHVWQRFYSLYFLKLYPKNLKLYAEFTRHTVNPLFTRSLYRRIFIREHLSYFIYAMICLQQLTPAKLQY